MEFEVKVEFTDFAVQCLNEIFNYYEECVSTETAEKVVLAIVDKAEELANYPNLGNLERYDETLKFILQYDFKILFKKIDKTIFITDIFHTSQHQDKIEERNK